MIRQFYNHTGRMVISTGQTISFCNGKISKIAIPLHNLHCIPGQWHFNPVVSGNFVISGKFLLHHSDLRPKYIKDTEMTKYLIGYGHYDDVLLSSGNFEYSIDKHTFGSHPGDYIIYPLRGKWSVHGSSNHKFFTFTHVR